MKAALILGTQLLERHPAFDDDEIDELFLVESAALFDRLPYHQHKIVLVLSAMRHMVDRLEREGRTVRTVRLGDGLSFAEGVTRLIERHGAEGIAWMRAADRGVDRRIDRIAARAGMRTRRWADRAFLTPEPELDAWFRDHPRARMEDFYRWQRQRTGILMEGESPAGGRWNYDVDNREPLPKGGIDIPPVPRREPDAITLEVIDEVRERFPDHPGDARDFWLPVTHEDARAWLGAFVDERLPEFGRFEDAMAADEPVLFHSVLTPSLNLGLLTPHDVVDAVLEASGDVPLPSLEGFVRQVIGWREYMRGMYRAHPELDGANALGLTRELEPWWYTGDGIPDELPVPVRTVLERVLRHGYAHHIERLMVLGNWFLLEGYAPASVNRWFLSLFVDAYEWVMVPNVFGMSQFADGGMVGTKPYVSGGAYLQRMGRWWPSARAAKESAFTDGYWDFLQRHEAVLKGNPRLALPLAQMRARREPER
ncbi:cryptochrome/photolyase family protein [Agrococcus jenensis]|uniref:Deoxyribodipyrimidine photolyase-related protein n=1 Tax=Agrococcus jenensis TaxID=46353 RepID=A0A3N2AV38_9MICO|nr:cryptochrome/photolyase family protein [Agrococcus jenensis]ROR66622.1 deoxyribodipyrimidine photolyase-related protein [Agrococcus jenensis]